jgi:hypothetical protein
VTFVKSIRGWPSIFLALMGSVATQCVSPVQHEPTLLLGIMIRVVDSASTGQGARRFSDAFGAEQTAK